MRILASASILIILVVCAGLSQGEVLSAKTEISALEIQQLIQEKGARSLQDRSLQENWNDLMRSVASGDEAWLDVAMAILHFSDGENSESINAALGEAIARSPKSVLRRLDGSAVKVQSVCGNTFGDAGWLGESSSASLAALLAQKESLEHLFEIELKSLRDECLGHVIKRIQESGR